MALENVKFQCIQNYKINSQDIEDLVRNIIEFIRAAMSIIIVIYSRL